MYWQVGLLVINKAQNIVAIGNTNFWNICRLKNLYLSCVCHISLVAVANGEQSRIFINKTNDIVFINVATCFGSLLSHDGTTIKIIMWTFV